ncbi:MAG: LysM peptidoglycan-binding domain-containing protein [Flavobacteriaceae bacterium]|jgi:LysM repeat protein|nr:LysM peptidoglycan-binding domain-containing protein [Flavobacteriaceae bacterium]
MLKNIFIILFLLIASAVFSQQKYTVVKGDTPYGISKKYGMSLDEFYKLNPKTKEKGIQIGETVLIKSGAKSSGKTDEKLGKIVLKPKQTIYGITKQYHISETELRKLNPDLDSKMKIGETLFLPEENIKKYGDSEIAETVETPKTTETPKDDIKNENTYTILEKDNYYRITKKFGISKDQLFALNPGLEEKGLHPGNVIFVKSQESITEETKQKKSEEKQETKSQSPIANDDYITYTVQSGDTVFKILNKFGISLDDLLELNPNLSGGLKAGMVLKIKKADTLYKKSGDEISVVFLLPFGFDSGDSGYRTMAMDFLAGAKLAVERNVKNGMKLDIKVIDAQNEKNFKNSLIQINPENTDLIIGPFFKSNVLDVLDYVGESKIPVVAPFANSEDLYGFGNLIIVETAAQAYADRIIEEVKSVYQNQKIYIVADDDGNNADYLKTGLEKQLKNANIILVKYPSEIVLDKNMMTGQSAPVIAILANDKDQIGENFGNRMIELGKETSGVKAFSMYFAPIFEKKIQELGAVNLIYLMDRKINNEGDFEKEILSDFKKKYCKTPSKYSVIGFDIVNDMLSRENKKGEILPQMGKIQTQLATRFEFERKGNGAFVNKGFRVIRLTQ